MLDKIGEKEGKKRRKEIEEKGSTWLVQICKDWNKQSCIKEKREICKILFLSNYLVCFARLRWSWIAFIASQLHENSKKAAQKYKKTAIIPYLQEEIQHFPSDELDIGGRDNMQKVAFMEVQNSKQKCMKTQESCTKTQKILQKFPIYRKKCSISPVKSTMVTCLTCQGHSQEAGMCLDCFRVGLECSG